MSWRNLPEILLLCKDAPFITAFNEAISSQWPGFARAPKIKITTLNERLSSIPDTTKFQLIVSPANCYGRLDGAFDDAISKALCRPPQHDYNTLTRAAQKVLYDKWRGFAPPGTCTLVRIPKELEGVNSWGCKWVAICPTMRLPSNAVWDREIVYECVWSLLCEIEGWNRRAAKEGKDDEKIAKILMTPLATGVGRVSEERWAAQTVLAMKHFVDALERPERWSELEWKDISDDAEEVEKTWKSSNDRKEGLW